jgi:hypothetical protein
MNARHQEWVSHFSRAFRARSEGFLRNPVYAACSRKMRELLGVSLASDGGDAIDFHQRISRQRRDRDGCAGWAAMRKVR